MGRVRWLWRCIKPRVKKSTSNNLRRYFADAVRLSPKKVGPHLGLALSISSANELGEALEELEIAQTMHPYSRHVSNIRHLIENRPVAPVEVRVDPQGEPEPDSGPARIGPAP